MSSQIKNPPPNSGWSEQIVKFVLFLIISLTIRFFYIFAFPNCHSFDLSSWNQVAEIMQQGGNPYHLTNFLNWPPCWMQLIFLAKKISLATRWPFNDVIRGFLIIAETALSLVLYVAILRFARANNAAKMLIIGIAINPVSVFQVCQHCNFDVLVGFWILLAVYLVLRFQERHESRFWLGACFALGLGGLTKTVPICLAPLLLSGLRHVRFGEKILGVVLLLGPIMLGLSVIYALAPDDVATKVLGYRSTPGNFGFSGLLALCSASRLLAMWPRIFELFFGLAWLLVSVWLICKKAVTARTIILLAAIMLVAIPAWGPGSGLQYIYWFLPLLVLLWALAGQRMKLFLLTMFGVAVMSYAIEYALNFKTYGAFLLEMVQTPQLLKWSQAISSNRGETLVMLPLWTCYLVFVVGASGEIGREMVADFKFWRRQTTAV